MYVVDHTLPYLILGLPELSKFILTIDCSHLQIKQNGNIVNKINKYKNERKYSLHINDETYVTPPHSQISEDQNVLPQIVIENRCELREILSHYDSIFSEDKKQKLRVKLRNYCKLGLFKETNSPYSVPVTLAFKRDEGKKTRLCIDFRKLNALCKADSEPLPIMDSLLDKILICHVFVDASQKSVGAVLKQHDAPNAYHSRTLRDYEKNYAITELECLAIIYALDKFYYYLHGQKFIIHTDHAALVWLKNVKNLRCRLFRWSLKLSIYDYKIKYLKGSTNIEADMLSRHPVAHHLQHSSHLLDINEIKTHQKKDNLCGPKYHEIKDVIVIREKILHKIVISFALRLKLLNQAHKQFGHLGVQKMLNLISLQYYWPNITTDISEFIKHCMVCQLNKKRKQKKFGLLQQVPPTSKPFEFISANTAGGFNYYNSTKKNLHIVIDHATRYVWAFPSKSENSEKPLSKYLKTSLKSKFLKNY
ncbi:hypothetical protein TNCV_222451 [Trichonephila clavipes]|nr:hypothetical protein TNCV_222451 [Trichonephila clavipes]